MAETSADLAPLDDLGRALAGRGYLTMIVTGAGRARLEVLARSDPARYGSVLCAPGDGGERWYWWAWADRIAPVAAVEPAADLVDRLLRARAAA